MAEVTTSFTGRNKKAVTKSHKLSTRVDLTPMVDLGFLLITFFIFTTAMAKPATMKLILPNDEDTTHPSLAPAEMTITFILGADRKIYFFDGNFNGNLQQSSRHENIIRLHTQRKAKEVQELSGDRHKTIVLIKVSDQAIYSDIVNALDEMVINGIKKYMLLDADEHELAAMKATDLAL